MYPFLCAPLGTPAPELLAEPEQVGAYEAKTHLPRMLERVEAGASFVITRHGRPVAMLVPVTPVPDRQKVIEALVEFASGRGLGEVTVRELVDEGRR